MSTDIVLSNVILSYPHLITPWAGQQNQEPKYNCAIIFPQNFGQWGELQQCVENAKMNKWGANAPQNLKLPWLNRYLQPNVLKEGPYAGCYVINANGDRKPQLVDANVQEVKDMVAKSVFFAGAIVNVYVNFYGYSTSGNNGVGTGLRMVQLVDNVNVTRLDGDTKEASEVFKTIPGAPAPTTAVPGAPLGAVPGAVPGAVAGGNPWD